MLQAVSRVKFHLGQIRSLCNSICRPCMLRFTKRSHECEKKFLASRAWAACDPGSGKSGTRRRDLCAKGHVYVPLSSPTLVGMFHTPVKYTCSESLRIVDYEGIFIKINKKLRFSEYSVLFLKVQRFTNQVRFWSDLRFVFLTPFSKKQCREITCLFCFDTQLNFEN